MKIQINPINYKNFIQNKNPNIKNNNFQQEKSYKLANYNDIKPLANLIFFQANRLSDKEKKEQIALRIKKYCPNIADDEICKTYMISDSALKSIRKTPEYKLGSRFFEVYHRIALYKNIP